MSPLIQKPGNDYTGMRLWRITRDYFQIGPPDFAAQWRALVCIAWHAIRLACLPYHVAARFLHVTARSLHATARYCMVLARHGTVLARYCTSLHGKKLLPNSDDHPWSTHDYFLAHLPPNFMHASWDSSKPTNFRWVCVKICLCLLFMSKYM